MLQALKRCRLPLISAGIILGLWHTPVLKPARLFMVEIHEMFHVGTAVLTGGKVTGVMIGRNEKGRTVSRLECVPIVASAGYVGSALLGAFLIYAGTRPRLLRLSLGMLGVSAIGVSLLYTTGGSLAFYDGLVGGLFLLTTAAGFREDAVKAAGTGLGVLLCLFVFNDFKLDLCVHPDITDAGVLARSLHLPDRVFPMVYAWLAVALGALSWALWKVDRAGLKAQEAHDLEHVGTVPGALLRPSAWFAPRHVDLSLEGASGEGL